MVFLRLTTSSSDRAHVVRAGGLVLRPPAANDYAAWAELRAASREHLAPWEPAWAGDELSRSAYRRRLRVYHADMLDDLGYAFFLFKEDEQRLIGGLTLGNVRRGVTQAATLGYWLGAKHVRHGHMTRAVAALVRHAFDELRLHRIEASCMPANEASLRVLQRNCFRQEGLARRYLKIDGEWRDHILLARLIDDAVISGPMTHGPTTCSGVAGG